MAATKLVGKTQRRRARTEREKLARKLQSFTPVIKKVNVEDLKAEFKTKPVKKEEPKAANKEVKAEKKATTKKVKEESKNEE